MKILQLCAKSNFWSKKHQVESWDISEGKDVMDMQISRKTHILYGNTIIILDENKPNDTKIIPRSKLIRQLWEKELINSIERSIINL